MTRDAIEGFETDEGPDEDDGDTECETCGEASGGARECPNCAEDSGRVAAESRAEHKAERRAMSADMGTNYIED